VTITPQVYERVRSELIAIFNWRADSLTPEQVLRLDNAVPMRWWLNDQHARIMRGEPVDMARVLTVSEAFARLLPPAVLASPPPSADRVDPRETMWKTYQTMRARAELAEKQMEPSLRARISELEAENELLKAGAGGTNVPGAPAGPASPMPEPDNVLTLSRSTPKTAPAASAAPPPPTAEERQRALAIANSPVPQHVRDTRPQNEPWRPCVEGSAFHDRWSNRNF